MILTDHEWLRFVTFALVVGTILGAVNTGALLGALWPLDRAMVGAIAFGGVLALVVHAILRVLLDQATDPGDGDSEPDEQPDEQPTEETTA
jgi:mannose/fructose/N-acetylgalactosamine-specific phosphotransferase system component IIC